MPTPRQRAATRIKSLKAGKRAVLGTREAHGALVHKLAPPRMLGEPRKMAHEISPSSNGRLATTKFQRARTHRESVHLHARRPRRTSIGKWRRSGNRITPR